MDKGGDTLQTQDVPDSNYLVQSEIENVVQSDMKVSIMEGPSINPQANPDESQFPISIDETDKFKQLNVMDMAKLETRIKHYKPKSDILKAQWKKIRIGSPGRGSKSPKSKSRSRSGTVSPKRSRSPKVKTPREKLRLQDRLNSTSSKKKRPDTGKRRKDKVLIAKSSVQQSGVGVINIELKKTPVDQDVD